MEIDKSIAVEIANVSAVSLSKLGLRFDKVAVGLLGDIRSAIEQAIPIGNTVVLTVTAPIKHPSKTALELIKRLKENDHPKLQAFTLFENKIQVSSIPSNRPVQFIGLVHNPGIDPQLLLEMTTKWLAGGT